MPVIAYQMGCTHTLLCLLATFNAGDGVKIDTHI